MKNNFNSQILKNKFTNRAGKDWTIIHNPKYIFPEIEIVPLAKKIKNTKKLVAAVMDMDGTTTTTEELCIHSLEFMIRKITNRLNPKKWIGLDHKKDYPNIIGNSTTKHVEYLIKTYSDFIHYKELKISFLYSALWNLIFSLDEGRKNETLSNLKSFEIPELLEDEKFNQLLVTKNFNHNLFSYFKNKYLKKLKINYYNQIVQAGIDVYYHRYHFILNEIAKGNSKIIAKNIFNNSDKHLIAPLEGVAFFLCLIKGLLGSEVINISNNFFSNSFQSKHEIEKANKKILKLSLLFQETPIKVAIVTSSIFYEAKIVLNEVFNLILKEIKNWNISHSRKEKILNQFCSYKNFYDAIVTANDSNEIRLKPHRDLYSIALQKLGVPTKDFNNVIGFEDSESGIIAMRSAGIGLCIAVPFDKSLGHNFKFASHIVKNGFKDVIQKHFLFIK